MAINSTLNSDIYRFFVRRLFLALVFIIAIFSTSIFAQTHLYRISKAERSDGLGYVVRYHFSAEIDSFTVIQPAPDLIQLQFFAESIDTTGIALPDEEGKIQEVRLYKMDDSYGVDVYLDPDIYVKASSYKDMNGKDILLALTKADKHEVEAYSQQFLARNWYLSVNPDNALDVSAPVAQVAGTTGTDSYTQVKDKLKFDTIIIDPGHGGHDPGNIGYGKKSQEKDVVLSIAKKLGGYIEKNLPDVNVIYTRDDDTYVDLWERGSTANRAEGDLFVSIHADGWTSPNAYGTSVFFLGLHMSKESFDVMKRENSVFNTHEDEIMDLTEEDLFIYELAHSGYIATSERIAGMIEHQFKNRANRRSRGVKQAGFVVLYQAAMPAILVETGFLTNPSEQRFLTSDYGQSIIASAIFRAIRDYKVEYEKTQAFSSESR